MAHDTLTVAAVQMSSQDDVPANLRRASERVAEAASRGAKLVLLPENFAFMGTEAQKREIAEPLGGAEPGRIADAIAEAARDAGVHVVAGGMPERSHDADRPYNTCAVFGPDGQLVARYRKIHLFDVDLADGTVYRESASVTPGATPITLDVEGFRLGLSICYDLRFPELYRALSDEGAEVVVVPAAFTLLTGKDHWHALLRARAIESQSYVVAAAQWGKHPRGRQTYGKSLVADPWGTVVAEASEGEGVVLATIDRAYLASVRRNLPALEHRRL